MTHRRILLVVAPLAVVLLYAGTFSGRPIVLQQIDVVADADASIYRVLLTQYRPDRVFGNATELANRDLPDITEAVKVKHVLYAIVGHVLWTTFDRLLPGTDPSGSRALFLVNATISAANMALFIVLATALGQPLRIVAPLSALYGA